MQSLGAELAANKAPSTSGKPAQKREDSQAQVGLMRANDLEPAAIRWSSRSRSWLRQGPKTVGGLASEEG